MRAADVAIVQPIAYRPDAVRHMFTTGPDAVPIEIVQAKLRSDGPVGAR
jgi:hypothetical protein